MLRDSDHLRDYLRNCLRPFIRGSLVALGLTTFALGACKKKDTCNPDEYVYEAIQLHVQASGDVNPNDEGEPLPTVVRVYQLNGDLVIRNLDFEELWTAEEGDYGAPLGDEYISDKEFQIHPDTMETIEIMPEDKARFLLVIGGFNQVVGNTWYRVYEIPDGYGQQACELKEQEKDPATLGEPCVYLYLERYQIDGGKDVPPGFDEDKVEGTCTPVYVPKTKTVEEDDSDKADK